MREDRADIETNGAQIVTPFDAFEKGAGTYLKVVRFSEPTNPDAFIILYLRPSGRFLFVGYWEGYEQTAAAGQWVREGSVVRLEGRGHASTDSRPGPEAGVFRHVLTWDLTNHTPTLTAPAELKGWSLLSWTGPFLYVGQFTVIDPDGTWLPHSISDVDRMIGHILQP
jgi:hypothetical protein